MGSGIRHTCGESLAAVLARPDVFYEPRSALNARSTFQLLAFKTALTTEASMLGKASLKVFSDCSLGLRGLGGFGGAAGGVSVSGCCAGAAVPDVAFES